MNTLDQPESDTTPLGAVTKTLWNAVGQVSSATDPLNHTTTYEWWASNTESAGRLKTVRSPVVTNTTPPGQTTTQSWSTHTWSILGDLTAIGYTGDSNLTPDVTITAHTRLGQPSTITQSGIGSETITFRPGLGVPLTHSYASSHTLLPGKLIAYNVPDAYGQPTGFTPSDGPVVAYAWQQGLLHTVTAGSQSFTYEYREDTAQVKNVTANNGSADTFRQTYSRDIANRLLAASSSVPGTTPVPLTRHGYRLDELNRRTRTTQLDGSTWTWGYTDRSEVTAASRKQLGGTEVAALSATYSYDEIGNRMTSTSPILGDFGYTTNSVNQYTTITSNNSRTVLGKAPATSTITVNGLATTRIDTLFHKGISADNSNDPRWLQADISDGTTTQTRNCWLPKASTALTYVGGDLTNDGQWSYLWDAENRLVEMATVSSVRPYRKLRFAYDWTGRRLSRIVTNSSNTVLSSTRWLYDDWNPVAEYAPLETGNLKLETSYLWGLDISGTLTDAGGVGGLLAVITSNPTTVYYPSFDGNGNITAWTQSGAAAPVCRREYDAFGNIVVEQGAAPCAFGFSTKLEDPETHLLYYGYRYYDPLTGRWPSRDPIEEEGGYNLYGFVGNDGVDWIDRLGLHGNDIWQGLYDEINRASIGCRSKAEDDMRNKQKEYDALPENKKKEMQEPRPDIVAIEYCTRVCQHSDKETKKITYYHSPPVTQGYHGSCDATKSAPCNKGDKTVGSAHNHPPGRSVGLSGFGRHTSLDYDSEGRLMGGISGDKGVADKGMESSDRDPSRALPPNIPIGVAPYGGRPTRIYNPRDRTKKGQPFDYTPPKPISPPHE